MLATWMQGIIYQQKRRIGDKMDEFDTMLDELNKLDIDGEIRKANARYDKLSSNINRERMENRRILSAISNVRNITRDYDREFEEKTGLNKADIKFLFLAVALQCARIYLINKVTKLESAGKGDLEKRLKSIQKRGLNNFSNGNNEINSEMYAPMSQIIVTPGVPYDATNGIAGLTSGNHRFTTLGHDPLIGLLFGTANILTNTITLVNRNSIIPIPHTYCVDYDFNPSSAKIYKNPVVMQVDDATALKNTSMMFSKIKNRVWDHGDYSSLIAAIIKQCIHIGTDLYTTAGIQIPGANLVLSGKNVEDLTRIISTGDLLKAGANAAIAELINIIISILHMLTYTPACGMSRELYNVKTRKIINYSGIIAQSCNIGVTVFKALKKGPIALKDMDFGGLLICMKNLITNVHVIHDIKMEFIFGNFEKQLEVKSYKSIFAD